MNDIQEILLTSLFVDLFVGIAAGLIAFFKAKRTMFTVGESWFASGYSVPGSARLTGSNDIFLRSHVRVEQKQTQNNSAPKGGPQGGPGRGGPGHGGPGPRH